MKPSKITHIFSHLAITLLFTGCVGCSTTSNACKHVNHDETSNASFIKTQEERIHTPLDVALDINKYSIFYQTCSIYLTPQS